MRRLIRTLMSARRPAPESPSLGCDAPVVQPSADWARNEARRLLADDEIAGDFLVGEQIDAPPAVLDAMEDIAREEGL